MLLSGSFLVVVVVAGGVVVDVVSVVVCNGDCSFNYFST